MEQIIQDIKKGKLKITGHFKSWVTDKNGNRHSEQEGENSIYASFYEAIAKALDTGYDIHLNNMFASDGIAPLYGDGIVIGEYAVPLILNQYAMVSTDSQPSANQYRVTGVLTNGTGASLDLINPLLGKSWSPPLTGGLNAKFLDFYIALFSGFTTTTVPNTEILTIVWTITFTVH